MKLSKKISLVFPHQLYEEHPALDIEKTVVLIEDSLFFGDKHYPLKLHAHKLILHRASMKAYEQELLASGYQVYYLDYIDYPNQGAVWKLLKDQEVKHCDIVEPVDFILSKRIKQWAGKSEIKITWHESPNFINTDKINQDYFSGRKRFFMADFYQHQRKRLNLMLDEHGNPEGGKWSFDTENRKKLPKKLVPELPELRFSLENKWTKEAKAYVKQYFSDCLGSVDGFIYPVNRQGANKWWREFLKERLHSFGPYEDAIVESKPFLYHGVLTPMLNIGLLNPLELVEEAIAHSREHDISMASLEGFVRQIIGWREFMRHSYESMGVKMRTANYWKHEYPMPKAFYEGNTGIVPIDNVIHQLHKYAYCHHIDRLMVLGGFMFLCRINPQDIYKWFMEFFIDAYDWVMVPNVFAMSQNSAGGLITTKPYFSGSNYIRKMSHYSKGPWCDTWDGLYWKFIWDHKAELASNPRWSMMVSTARRMDESKMQKHLDEANKFMEKLFSGASEKS